MFSARIAARMMGDEMNIRMASLSSSEQLSDTVLITASEISGWETWHNRRTQKETVTNIASARFE